jgi:endonuclease/exonuclease/phosphatase family metal-dependent hydrolase
MQNLRRLILFVLTTLLWTAAQCSADPFCVTTWNLRDFPSGVHNLRKPEVESTRIEAAAAVLKKIAPDVLILQEVRDKEACEKLAEAIEPGKYRSIVCSEFRDRSGIPTFQQVAILSRFPAVQTSSDNWHTVGLIDLPRGFAFVLLDINGQRVAFYSLHLKSNLVMGGDAQKQAQLNILKRELAAEQLLRHVEKLKATTNGVSAFVVGGDFNTNPDTPLFVSERTLGLLEGAGFLNCFGKTSPAGKVTCPENGRYPDATFDYLYFVGLRKAGDFIISTSALSDHLPVSCTFEIEAIRTQVTERNMP